ncbi:hypothetical protein ABPG77_004858 [Micractinium sp. CCAP 211/92]
MMVAEDAECPFSLRHVEEAGELNELVVTVADSAGKEAEAVFSRFAQIVGKYQEQPQLLDPLLEGIVTPLTALLRAAAENPPAADLPRVRAVARLLWQLSIVRGYKTVLRFFPNDVPSFEPVVALLSHVDAAQQRRSELAAGAPRLDDGAGFWEVQYVLLLWLSMLVLIPFDIAIVDSSLAAEAAVPAAADGSGPAAAGGSSGAAAQAGAGRQGGGGAVDDALALLVLPQDVPPIVGTILSLCQRHLASPGSTREMAAVVVGRLLTRPDMAPALAAFLPWGCAALGSQDSQRASFLVPGTALAFATLFKLGQRSAMLVPASQVFPHAVQLLGSQLAASNALARKLAVKLIQRIGLVFLRPRVAPWRYQKGQRSNVAANLEHRAAAAAAATEAEAEEDVEHAEQLEGVIEALLTGLADRDTVVRWSAAKGVGRLTGRLPRDLADDVVASLLDSFFTTGSSDTAWHGGCLGLAELARRGLLLPERLPEVTPLVVRALEYDVRRGPCSVGAHVRDAAAYVCWAFARAYSPETLGATVATLAPALITMACYDREVNCRRAAAAAFQECVGRLGSFPHGIDILTAADYFTVSVRQNAYLTVAPYVAGFPEYLEPLAWHLLRSKLCHWEKGLRELAAQALAALVPHRPGFFLDQALPFLLPLTTDPVMEARHGAVAALAELLPAFSAVSIALPLAIEAAAAEVIPAIDRGRLTRGKGGEVMRSAICRLAETTSAAGLPLSHEQQQCLLAQLRENLRHPAPEIQAAAAAALAAFAARYLPHAAVEAQHALVAGFMAALRDSGSVAARRGGALALGALPRWLLHPRRSVVVAALAAATVPEAAPEERDAESRVNAARALARVAATLLGLPAASGAATAAGPPNGEGGAAKGGGAGRPLDSRGSSTAELSDEELHEACSCVLEPLLATLGDYSIDNRGDVGSWVREAGMDGLAALLPPLLPCAPRAPRLLGLTQGALLAALRQAAERIARMREAAAACLQRLLPAAAAAGVPLARELSAAVCGRPLEQFSNLEALPALAALIAHPALQEPLLEGFTFSIGGLDSQLSTAAGDALADAVQERLGDDVAALEGLGGSLLALWRRQQRGGRLCTPLLLTADLLLSRTGLRDLESPGSTFPEQLLELVRDEVRGCTDVPRLHAAAGVLCQVASLAEPVRSGALCSALLLLGNRYPKVRRYAAEQVYTLLLTWEPADDGSQDVDAAAELVLANPWDGPLAAVRPARAQVFRLMGLPEPVPAAPGGGAGGSEQQEAGGAAAAQAAAADENASYQALLTHTQRGM